MTVRELIEALKAMPQDLQVGHATTVPGAGEANVIWEPIRDVQQGDVSDVETWGQFSGPCVHLR